MSNYCCRQERKEPAMPNACRVTCGLASTGLCINQNKEEKEEENKNIYIHNTKGRQSVTLPVSRPAKNFSNQIEIERWIDMNQFLSLSFYHNTRLGVERSVHRYFGEEEKMPITRTACCHRTAYRSSSRERKSGGLEGTGGVQTDPNPPPAQRIETIAAISFVNLVRHVKILFTHSCCCFGHDSTLSLRFCCSPAHVVCLFVFDLRSQKKSKTSTTVFVCCLVTPSSVVVAAGRLLLRTS